MGFRVNMEKRFPVLEFPQNPARVRILCTRRTAGCCEKAEHTTGAELVNIWMNSALREDLLLAR